MKFAKVMFLHVSVCPGGEYLSRYTPRAGTTLEQVHPRLGRYSPWAGTSPSRYTPRDRYPHAREQCMLGDTGNKRAVQQACGTHPTGMHSCLFCFFNLGTGSPNFYPGHLKLALTGAVVMNNITAVVKKGQICNNRCHYCGGEGGGASAL